MVNNHKMDNDHDCLMACHSHHSVPLYHLRLWNNRHFPADHKDGAISVAPRLVVVRLIYTLSLNFSVR